MLIPALFVFFASLLLTGLIRRYALNRQLLDIPNERSSHLIPTPRGGGLACVLSITCASLFLYWTKQLSLYQLATISTCIPVAIIGFLDDHGHVRARWRLLIHVLAASSAIYCINLSAYPLHIDSPALINMLIAIFLLVWSLNLFNFMDGTDGIAASEAVFVASSLAGFLYAVNPSLSMIGICISAAVCGFLCWNWPSAKIFMGDVGSGYLGLMLGLLILLSALQAPALLFSGLILYGLFICDASYTLLIRVFTGQPWHQAHRSHTYQHAAARYGHLPVLIICWVINLFWLLPLATLVFFHPDLGIPALLGSYIPLLLLANYYKAGHA